jgi:hypothetical protein
VRKLVLSLCVVAASAAYVAEVATSSEGGVEALFDRVTFRPAALALPPLDLDSAGSAVDDPLSAPLPPRSDLAPASPGSPDLASAPPAAAP